MSYAILARRNIQRKIVQPVTNAGKGTDQVTNRLSSLIWNWDDEGQSITIWNKLEPRLTELPDPEAIGTKVVMITCRGLPSDIGYRRLDHVIALGQDVKIIMLDAAVG
jgi:pyruvate/2-oxoacid:ferredoxin oxidoreductase beta subunit